MKSLVSFFGGSAQATSFLTRRNMNGRRTVCNFRITFSCPSFPDMENHSSNCSESPNISGSRKFSRAHSSCRLFWRGVPVIKRRKPVLSNRTALLSEEFSFLILCASSMIRYLQSIFPNTDFSFNTASYEQTSASNLYLPVVGSGRNSLLTHFWRSSLVPPMRMALMDGHHLRNSLHQLPTTDFGTMTMWGPLTPRASLRYAKREMV
mmetsp:Transcript_13792/g.29115  ORF Transcript_13792/g.29115 Transcript_13792/m.29115 type:complete len:207 (+) Transcript_13792:3709-4329(+)